MSKKGFIKIQRKLFDNFLWNEARVFSKAEAWIDLIQTARFEATQEVIQNKVIELHKGELPASRRYLEKRWSWGSTKVANYLKTLETLGMINQRQTRGQTIISLCNYCSFQEKQTKDKPQNEPRANHGQTTSKPNKKNLRAKELKENNDDDVIATIDSNIQNYLKNEKLVAGVRKSQKISESDLGKYLMKFKEHLGNQGIYTKETQDFRTHFIRWLKIQLKNSTNNGTGKNKAFD